MKRNILIAFGSLLLLFGIAYADNALRVGDVYDLPVMYLDRGITSTQTGETGKDITLAPPIRNFTEVTIPSMSGAVFEFRKDGYVETVFASRLIVNTSTNVATLTGTVIRDLCFNVGRTFTTCGDPRAWAKGTEVRLVNSSRLYNDKASRNSPNLFSASGAIAFTGSGSNAFPVYATTTDRDHNLGTGGQWGLQACVSATNLCYYTMGGSWNAYGNTGVSNATETTAGISEGATITDQGSRTATGNSGGPLFLQPKYLTSSGAIHGVNGSIYASRIPMLNSSGALSTTLGGTGLVNPGSGSLLYGAGSGKLKTIDPGTRGNVLWSDGTKWAATGSLVPASRCSTAEQSMGTLSSATYVQFDADLSCSLSVSVGSLVMLTFQTNVTQSVGAGIMNIDFKAGNGLISGYEGGQGTRGFGRVTTSAVAQNANVTIIHRVMTGGTLVFTPMGLISANSATFGDTFFQATILRK